MGQRRDCLLPDADALALCIPALKLLHHPEVRNSDVSVIEWGDRPVLPIEN